MGRPKKDPPFIRVLERAAGMLRADADAETPEGFEEELNAALAEWIALRKDEEFLTPGSNCRRWFHHGLEHYLDVVLALGRGEAITRLMREEGIPWLLKSAESGDKDSEWLIDRLLPPLLASENPMMAYLAGRALRKPGRRAAMTNDELRNANAQLLHEKPDAKTSDLADKLIRERRGNYHPDTLRRRLKNIL